MRRKIQKIQKICLSGGYITDREVFNYPYPNSCTLSTFLLTALFFVFYNTLYPFSKERRDNQSLPYRKLMRLMQSRGISATLGKNKV